MAMVSPVESQDSYAGATGFNMDDADEQKEVQDMMVSLSVPGLQSTSSRLWQVNGQVEDGRQQQPDFISAGMTSWSSLIRSPLLSSHGIPLSFSRMCSTRNRAASSTLMLSCEQHGQKNTLTEMLAQKNSTEILYNTLIQVPRQELNISLNQPAAGLPFLKSLYKGYPSGGSYLY